MDPFRVVRASVLVLADPRQVTGAQQSHPLAAEVGAEHVLPSFAVEEVADRLDSDGERDDDERCGDELLRSAL